MKFFVRLFAFLFTIIVVQLKVFLNGGLGGKHWWEVDVSV